MVVLTSRAVTMPRAGSGYVRRDRGRSGTTLPTWPTDRPSSSSPSTNSAKHTLQVPRITVPTARHSGQSATIKDVLIGPEGTGARCRARGSDVTSGRTTAGPGDHGRHRVVFVRKLVATVFNCSLDGLIADEGTEFFKFCFEVNGDLPSDPARLDLLEGAYAHLMGRTAYESMATVFSANPDHPWTDLLNAGRKVVFSRTLKTAEWANTSIAAGDTAEEIDELRRGGDDHLLVWGGITFWRSLMRLDLIDELRVDVYPYVAGQGTRPFEDVPTSYRLDLVSTNTSNTGIVELQYRRHR